MYGIHIKKFLVLILHGSSEHVAHVWPKTGGDYNNKGLERRLFFKISNRTPIRIQIYLIFKPDPDQGKT